MTGTDCNRRNHRGRKTPTAYLPAMTTVERAQLLLDQDAAITARIQEGATLDEAVDPSNKEFGPRRRTPEQVQMRGNAR